MQQREQERCARNRRAADTLEDIATEILNARDLVWAGFMAAQQLDGHNRDALGQLLDTVAKRLAAAAEKLEQKGRQEGHADAA